jgi:signal transduction histidine kinase
MAVTLWALDRDGVGALTLVAPFLLTIAISLAGVLLSPREMLLVTLLALVDAYGLYIAGMPAVLLLHQQHGTALLTLLITISVVFVAVALIALLTRRRFQRVLDERQALYAALQAKEQYQAQLLAQLLTAQEQERQRLAHNLHDGPLQDLSVLLLSLESCRRQIRGRDPSTMRADLQQARDLGDAIFVALRTLMSDLRPPALDTIGLVAALDQLAQQETTFRVTLTTHLAARLEPSLETLIFRLVQEGLANIRKHAYAHHAWIWVDYSLDMVWLQIQDDGQGFAVEPCRVQALATGHLGLASMQERVAAVGGHLVIKSSPDQGTMLHFAIPSSHPPPLSDTGRSPSRQRMA